MIQAAKFYFKGKVEESGGDFTRNLYIGLAVIGLVGGLYFYYHQLESKHHRRPTAAAKPAAPVAEPVPAAVAAAPVAKADVALNPEPVAVPAAVVGSNSVPADGKKVSLGDSLMAVFSPSAKAATIQPLFQTPKQSGTVPVSRQALRARASISDDSAELTDEQKFSLAVQNGFMTAIDLAGKNPDIYGFKPKERIDLATLGEPLRVYTVATSGRESYQDGQPIKSILQATNEWIFPVTLNGRVRFMVPIKQVDGEYVVGTSSRALAMVYEKIQKRWPVSEGYHPQLVVNANISNYYFTIPELPEQNLTAIGDMFQYNPTLSPASVILASWR